MRPSTINVPSKIDHMTDHVTDQVTDHALLDMSSVNLIWAFVSYTNCLYHSLQLSCQIYNLSFIIELFVRHNMVL